jgi:hypothetical protein
MATNWWESNSYLYSQSQALLAETPAAELQALKCLTQSKTMIPVKIIKHIPPVRKLVTGIVTGRAKVKIV